MAESTVLHVIDALNVGGAQELLVLLAKFTPPGRSMAVCVLQPDLAVGPRLEAHGARIFALNRKRPSIASPLSFAAYAMGGVRDIMRLIRKTGARAVHCHLSDAEFLGILAGRLAGAPRVAMTFHTPKLLPERDARDPRNRLRFFAMRRIYGRADAVVAVSSETLRSLRDEVGLAPDKLFHIPNGVDCDDLSSRTPPPGLAESLNIAPGDTVMLNLGRLVALKGQIHILKAMAQLTRAYPNLKLLIAGDGPERETLDAAVARLGLTGKALLLGARSDVPDLLALSHIVIGASLWEGTSLALMEAMAAGKALAVTDIPGNLELLKDGETALIFPPADPPAMAGAIQRLLDDPALAARLAGAAYAEARRRFDIRRVVAAYEELWR